VPGISSRCSCDVAVALVRAAALEAGTVVDLKCHDAQINSLKN
jgi:hypothetical protein